MEKLKRSLGSFVVPLLSIILAFVIGGIIMAALGANPFDAVKYLFQGAFGSKANIGTTLTKATPLMFTSLCACFAYKCGVFNLGGEGQFLMGSIAAFVTAYFSGVTGFAGVLLALLAGTLAGGIWGMIPGLLKIGRGQNEMIISIMLNYVATLFMGVLYTSWIRDASVPQTPAVDDLVKLPRVITGMRFTWGFVIAVVVGLVLYYVLFWTSGGFKLRAVGYNMTASRFNGIHVKRCMLTSFIISGAIAGLGGGAELLGTQFRLINGFGAGYGFDGVAMALIGQLHPIAAAQIQRQGAPRPRCGQDELQPVHPLGVLCAKVQPVRPGHKFGAAALLLEDLDLHAKPPFLFAVPIVPPGAQNYPVCTKNVKFSVLRHFAKRGFGTGNASFSPLPGPGNSPAGFPCKTRDVGQLVLGAAAAAAALFAEKRAGANVKNS